MEWQLQQREDDEEKTAKSHQRETEHSKGFCQKKKKCVIVFRLKEEVLLIRHIREQHKKNVAEMVETVCEEQFKGNKLKEEIEKVFRIGKYEKTNIGH